MGSVRILIAAGGTGGHLLPAQVLAQQLSELCEPVEIAFLGGRLSTNTLFEKERFLAKDIACGTLSIRRPLRSLLSLGKIFQGIGQSLLFLRRFKPQSVIGFGSYYSLPALLAALFLRIPVILHESDIVCGKVNRLLSPYALLTAILFPPTAQNLKGKSTQIHPLLRQGHNKAKAQGSSQARQFFGLHPDRQTLLIFGGSQGAQSINQLMYESLPLLQDLAHQIQFIHLAGSQEESQRLQQRYTEYGFIHHVAPFHSRMDLAWGAADLALTRAGALTIAEQIEWEVPAILIPYPYAASNHQESNADFVVSLGGAVKMVEKTFTSKEVQGNIRELLFTPKRLKEMAAGLRSFKTDSKENFVHLVYTQARKQR